MNEADTIRFIQLYVKKLQNDFSILKSINFLFYISNIKLISKSPQIEQILQEVNTSEEMVQITISNFFTFITLLFEAENDLFKIRLIFNTIFSLNADLMQVIFDAVVAVKNQDTNEKMLQIYRFDRNSLNYDDHTTFEKLNLCRIYLQKLSHQVFENFCSEYELQESIVFGENENIPQTEIIRKTKRKSSVKDEFWSLKQYFREILSFYQSCNISEREKIGSILNKILIEIQDSFDLDPHEFPDLLNLIN